MANYFDPYKSLTYMVVKYFRPKPGKNHQIQKYYSQLDRDKKSREKGIETLRRLALKEHDKQLIEFAAIFDNEKVTGFKNRIETIIENGKRV